MLSSLGILILSSATEVMLVTLRSLLIRIFIVAQVSFRFLHRTEVSLWNAAFLALFLEHWLFTSYFPASANTIDFSFIAVVFSFFSVLNIHLTSEVSQDVNLADILRSWNGACFSIMKSSSFV